MSDNDKKLPWSNLQFTVSSNVFLVIVLIKEPPVAEMTLCVFKVLKVILRNRHLYTQTHTHTHTHTLARSSLSIRMTDTVQFSVWPPVTSWPQVFLGCVCVCVCARKMGYLCVLIALLLLVFPHAKPLSPEQLWRWRSVEMLRWNVPARLYVVVQMTVLLPLQRRNLFWCHAEKSQKGGWEFAALPPSKTPHFIALTLWSL